MSDVKVVDCFMFYNELDLLLYRLHTVGPHVDHFVLVESTRTHVGKEKPLIYAENQHLFEAWRDKIIHVVVDDFPHLHPVDVAKNEQWKNENFQRNAICRGLPALNDGDLVIVTDLDEIPDPSTLQRIKAGDIKVTVNSLEMDFYYYNLNTRFRSKWTQGKILNYATFKALNKTCTEIRQTPCAPIPKGGWHLSYFGDAAFIHNKMVHFAHQEYNSDFYTNVAKIHERVKSGRDIYERNVDIETVAVADNAYLPVGWNLLLQKYVL